ncbi:translin [Piliocolobus tephrosceles]|uniref:translin n=1 Tax=Piliocolobus tephrosceles TaxID=591936 RepID=UPI000E6B121D|nr:translin [Piliocolobus tephrosceles]
MSVSEIFVELQGFLAAEQDIREEIRKVVQSLEQTAREILTLLQGVHQGAGFQDIPKRCLKAREHFGTVKTHLTSLKTKFPAEQYYSQKLKFACFLVWIKLFVLLFRQSITVRADTKIRLSLSLNFFFLSTVISIKQAKINNVPSPEQQHQ